jgi:hypothetical protein
MGTWNTSLKGNDTFLDIYHTFMDLYNEGKDPKEISKEIQEDYEDMFNDYEDGHNSYFALALAQWETKTQDETIFNKVKAIIQDGKEYDLWKELGADEKTLNKRQNIVDTFLQKISKQKDKPKRRFRQKLEFLTKELVRITAPDGRKTFTVYEHFTNGIYGQTGSMLSWVDGGSGIMYYNGEGIKIRARWIDSQNLEIIHEKGIDFLKKEENFYYCGDQGQIHYRPFDFDDEKNAL